jgi:excinuclease ABC subunit C
MVVFEGGKPHPTEYRRFRIKTVEGANDVASHQEVLRRRFKRLLAADAAVNSEVAIGEASDEVTPDASAAINGRRTDDGVNAAETVHGPVRTPAIHGGARAGEGGDSGENGEDGNDDGEARETSAPGGPVEERDVLLAGSGDTPAPAGDDAEPETGWGRLPDLVIVDGGRPQLNAALAVLNELDVRVPAIGIAKENHGAIGTHEEIYLPDRPNPIILDRGSQGLYLLQRVRDEAHRFAITYHRQVRTTRTLRSQLDDIAGIGPKRKKALIKRFGSLKGIAAATVDELASVDGMTRDVAERVKEQIGRGAGAF